MRIFGRRKSDPEPEPVEPEPEPEPEPLSLLIVDDDDDLRDVMAMALAREGFDIVGGARNAVEALDLVGQEPDLILLDLHMPDVGGLELLPQLKELAPRSRVVVCSAITASHMLEASQAAGAHGFIVKGVAAKSIAAHLHRVASSGSVKVVRPFPLNRDYDLE